MARAESEITMPKVVLVLGKTGVGKSTFIKAATGLNVAIGDSLNSCTHEVQIYWVPNTTIFLIDTPGFDDPTRSDADILQSIASCLADLYEGLIFNGHSVGLAGVIYAHDITGPRMMGTMMQNSKMFRHLVGQEHMRHCVLLTTKWGLELDKELAKSREHELARGEKYWKADIGAGAIVRRFGDTNQSALEVLEAATRTGSFTPQLTREYVVDGAMLMDTSAGRAINEDVAALRAQQISEIEEIRQEHSRAVQTRDDHLSSRLALLRSTTEERLQTFGNDSMILAATREEARERMDDLELKNAASLLPIYSLSSETAEEKHHRRTMKALRWFVRFATLGSAVTLTGLSHGALAPVAISVVFGIEMILQAMKDREREKIK